MHRRTARGNRVGLTVTGLVLVIAGAALFAAYRSYYGGVDTAKYPIYPASARRFVHQQGGWLWPVVAAVSIVVGLVFLRWLLVQARIDRVRTLVVDSDAEREIAGPNGAPNGVGRTRMPATAITDVVEDDLVGLRGVRRASATVSGHTDAPELWLRVVTEANADVGRIRADIVDTVVPDVRTCLEAPEMPAYLTLQVSRHESARTRRR